MSVEQDEHGHGPDEGLEERGDLEVPELDDVEVKDLLRKALDPPARPRKTNTLADVQKRIHQESDGKFFADGWSTSRSPRATFLVTSLIMLIFVVITWLLLSPVRYEVVP